MSCFFRDKTKLKLETGSRHSFQFQFGLVLTQFLSFVLSEPSLDEFCLVSTQFPISVWSHLDPVSMSFVLSQANFDVSCLSFQDKTVLSGQCQRCQHNWRRDKTVLSCRVGGVNTRDVPIIVIVIGR